MSERPLLAQTLAGHLLIEMGMIFWLYFCIVFIISGLFRMQMSHYGDLWGTILPIVAWVLAALFFKFFISERKYLKKNKITSQVTKKDVVSICSFGLILFIVGIVLTSQALSLLLHPYWIFWIGHAIIFSLGIILLIIGFKFVYAGIKALYRPL